MRLLIICLSLLLSFTINLNAQTSGDKEKEKSVWDDGNFSGLKFRSVGPAYMTGRVADIAIHPKDDNVWYAAIGSGGVWKTENAGITWNPIFDKYPVYSTGCITIDEKNPHKVWLGTGENVGGRHASWGDGIYLSEDDGKSWKNMGLKKSEHLSKIIVHPTNSNIVWVASQGPLWSKGGERGVYKTIDGGKTWKNVLAKGEFTGATDLLIDPRDPNKLYAALWQHHRTVAAYMGGGPESGIFSSCDGGETWEKMKGGLPSGNMGKIGLAISPQQPDVLYAAIELDLRKGGVYKSENMGASWKKMSDQISGGTGPHYYQELYACPHNFDRIYFANNRFKVSHNGGKTFVNVPNKWKHVDNHSLTFRADDPEYLLVGTDGGIYESFDLGTNWRHFSNMPITQYYKLAVDDAEPFYNIYGGTQDNNTQGGPSRTDKRQGITNGDWKIVMGGDGHQPATEPGNPNIVYAQWQQGNLNRIDVRTGDRIYIKPQPAANEKHERTNWDAPILVSPHNPTKIYTASYRLWMSENRGDSWTAISEDLTRDEERFDLPIMGRKQSFENPWDVYAMSTYNTITSISESPAQEGLIYVGTDDGLVSVTENGGITWRTKSGNTYMNKFPTRAYVNDIKADRFDAKTVYMALDNHKEGDYTPYLFKSTNKGKRWKSIASNLPDSTLVWRIVQDHIRKDLLFIGTEFGIYFTTNAGEKWTKLTGDLPTISFRDLTIQKREDDLVAASFGRSFYIYDDIAVFRNLDEASLNAAAKLFPLRDAKLYKPKGRSGNGSLGANFYTAKNPEFGAAITYHIKEGFKSKKDLRKKAEKEFNKNKLDVPFPGWDKLEEEAREAKPEIWLTIKDLEGKVLSRIKGSNKKGFHKANWDLRAISNYPIEKSDIGKTENTGSYLVAPGKYTVTLTKIENGEKTVLDAPVTFNVVKLRDESLPVASDEVRIAFYKRFSKIVNEVTKMEMAFKQSEAEFNLAKEALVRTKVPTGYLAAEIAALTKNIYDLKTKFEGNSSKNKPGEKTKPDIWQRVYFASSSAYSIYGPTIAAKQSLNIGENEFEQMQAMYNKIENSLEIIKTKLKAIDAPYFDGN